MSFARGILRPLFLRSFGRNTKTPCSAVLETPFLYNKNFLSPQLRLFTSTHRFSSTMPSNEGPNVLQNTPKVLIIGGSYSGLAATVNLLDLCDGKPPRFSSAPANDNSKSISKLPVDITIVDERDGYYHLIGNPLAFASDDAASKSWTRFRDIPALKLPNVRFLQGSVATIDCEKKVAWIVDTVTEQRRQEPYDYLLVASGLRRTSPVVPQALDRDQFLAEARTHTKSIRDAKEGVVVIGGGAVGIEMASEIKVIEPWQKVTLIHSRDKLLSAEPLPDDFKERSLEVLKEAGVEVIMGQRVTDTTTIKTDAGSKSWRLTLANGEQITAGHVITAISRSTPTSGYLPATALDKHGYVKIDASLRFTGDVPNSQSHFAAGDIASWSGIKRCGGAMHMGHYCAINIHQDMLKHRYGQLPTYKELSEFPNIMGLAVGKKAVIFDSTNGTSSGEDLMGSYFGNDLANSICWNYMKLGQAITV
ncbi:FAD/NAD(P)-binding domain-containing protein [Aureobasidium pullulans]|uniref:FAD/NAD(P)-binding domain-containing protein n=1 Tax=Aureobasidium pullulans TaxID=5580 RepID=A0A4S9VMR2_AURPU|nr:FAD/NAD(P)-binding domain-containing protein [Aureobasidium pullulans]